MKSIVIIVAAILCMPCYASKVIGVLDGDTLEVLENGVPLRIRLANIDAPERSQAFGQASKKSLSELCYGKNAVFVAQKIDRYGRTLAVVMCNGVEVNRAQIERGLAWVYTSYNKDVRLPVLQEAAKAKHIGLWHDAVPTAPWNYRHQKPELRDATTCFVGSRGGRYMLVERNKYYGC